MTSEHEAQLRCHFAGTGTSIQLSCFSGLKLILVFELIAVLTESNGQSFFEHDMRFWGYSAAICNHINRFQSKGQA